jgi:ATP-dependent Clp protease protease subunit
MIPGQGRTTNTPSIWVNNFTEEDSKEFFVDFNMLNSDDTVQNIVLYIDSYGGDIDSLSAMCELIEASTKPIITIGIGKVMSAGAMLMAMGTPGMRYAGELTDIMYHRMHIDFMFSDVEVAKSVLEHLAKNNEKWLKKVVSRSKLSWKEFNQKLKEKNGEWWMTSKEALKYGFIDQIGIPMIKEISQTQLVL